MKSLWRIFFAGGERRPLHSSIRGVVGGAALPLLLTIGIPPAAAAGASLQILNKETARVARMTAETDQPLRFGALEITLKACVTSPPLATPQTSAFLVIREGRGDILFSGWMFAETPALHALDDPVYDVELLACAP